MKKINANKEYTDWCKKIAKEREDDELIAHFRQHVSSHFHRHKNEGKVGRMIWMVAIFNFMNIFKEKYKIPPEDLLFQLCTHYKGTLDGPKPKFDIDKFIEEYKSELREYYYQPKRLKKWNATFLPRGKKVA